MASLPHAAKFDEIEKNDPGLPDQGRSPDGMLVSLGLFLSSGTEGHVLQSHLSLYRAGRAIAPFLFTDAHEAFSKCAEQPFLGIFGTTVIGRTGGAYAHPHQFSDGLRLVPFAHFGKGLHLGIKGVHWHITNVHRCMKKYMRFFQSETLVLGTNG
jgi:hypothetical protein